MTPAALWLPFEVTDLEAATSFYTDRIGLSTVDGWDRDGERGVVLRVAGGAFVELVSPGREGPAPLAFELTDPSEVDSTYARVRPSADELIAAPHRYPRGHYGFELRGPAGAQVMIWSER